MKRERTEVRRRQIAEAALKVMAQQGLRRFTAAAIAREVGISDGALFRHFPDKAAIVAAALDRAEEMLFDGFPPEHPDPVERLGLFFQQRVALVAANPALVNLVISNQLALAAGAEGAERVGRWKARSAAFILECLQEAAAAGVLREGVELPALRLVVYGSMLSLGMAGQIGLDDGDTEPSMLWRTLRRLITR